MFILFVNVVKQTDDDTLLKLLKYPIKKYNPVSIYE